MSEMNDWVSKVRDFHVKFGVPVAPRPGVPPHDQVKLRAKLLAEESTETAFAMLKGNESAKQAISNLNRLIEELDDPVTDINQVADGLIDTIYVAIGAGLSYGLPMEALFDAVHSANMRKEGGGSREDGKITKPIGWKAPDIGTVLDLYA